MKLDTTAAAAIENIGLSWKPIVNGADLINKKQFQLRQFNIAHQLKTVTLCNFSIKR